MKNLSRNKFAFLLCAAFGLTACQTPTTTTTTNANTNTNTNQTTVSVENSNGNTTMMSNANNNSTASANSVVEASEPQQYQATVTLSVEAGGNDKKMALPKISAQVARSGDNRRMEFTLPSGEKVIYLDLGGKQLIVSPQRKQYAELDKDSLGVDVRRLLTPAQIVDRVKAMNGVERVGEEKYNGRDAVKYQYQATTNTQTKAGNVETNSVIYVDKETGLPLHSETASTAQGGAVNGINNVRFVTEMTNLQPTADASLFAEPTDYQKVAPEQIRQQLNALFNIVGTFIGQAMQQTQQTAISPTPTATPK
ncbi:MAG: hypothetical protein ACR2GD_04870 [Pyrinomonadaceae bacterium]